MGTNLNKWRFEPPRGNVVHAWRGASLLLLRCHHCCTATREAVTGFPVRMMAVMAETAGPGREGTLGRGRQAGVHFGEAQGRASEKSVSFALAKQDPVCAQLHPRHTFSATSEAKSRRPHPFCQARCVFATDALACLPAGRAAPSPVPRSMSLFWASTPKAAGNHPPRWTVARSSSSPPSPPNPS